MFPHTEVWTLSSGTRSPHFPADPRTNAPHSIAPPSCTPRDSLSTWCEFVPQMIFLNSLFGYLCVLILLKWATGATTDLYHVLIYMFLKPGEIDGTGETSRLRPLWCASIVVVPRADMWMPGGCQRSRWPCAHTSVHAPPFSLAQSPCSCLHSCRICLPQPGPCPEHAPHPGLHRCTLDAPAQAAHP